MGGIQIHSFKIPFKYKSKVTFKFRHIIMQYAQLGFMKKRWCFPTFREYAQKRGRQIFLTKCVLEGNNHFPFEFSFLGLFTVLLTDKLSSTKKKRKCQLLSEAFPDLSSSLFPRSLSLGALSSFMNSKHSVHPFLIELTTLRFSVYMPASLSQKTVEMRGFNTAYPQVSSTMSQQPLLLAPPPHPPYVNIPFLF